MKKIPTLFKRVFENHSIKEILPNVTPGMEFVLEGKGDATIKFDGSCCAIIDGKFYVRYDAKNGKPVPENAIKCQDEADAITGHLPCWIPYDDTNPGQKWFGKALENSTALGTVALLDGTYEAIGPHFNGNMYKLDKDTLVKHGTQIVDVPRTFEGIREYLKENYVEGIVFWLDGEPKCKIKRSDFGFSWQPKKIESEEIIMKSDEKKYFVKESWIFNLESMHDKLWCIIYDIRENKLKNPIEICGTKIESEEDVHELLKETENLEWAAKSRKVTSKEYGRIKQFVNWRVEQRYATCLNSGMEERQAGQCFEDL